MFEIVSDGGTMNASLTASTFRDTNVPSTSAGNSGLGTK